MYSQLIPAVRMVVFFTLLTGLVYPSVVTMLAQVLFPWQANGSLLGSTGSALIGQNFELPQYLHPRPSGAGDKGYDPMASGAPNLGPTSQKLRDRVRASEAAFRKENPEHLGPIPIDAITASSSGLDPDVSIANADAQLPRIAKARGIPLADVRDALRRMAVEPTLGIFGEPHVNVLRFNLMLDGKLR
jgi:K+-transporting ATPase ATPase C chain